MSARDSESQGTPDWYRPANGTRRFEEGHTKSLTHGARSERLPELVAPRTAELTDAIFEAGRDFLDPERDMLAVRGLAMAEAVVERLGEWIAENGLIAPSTGQPRAVLDALRQWATRAETARARLGFDPRARAELRLDVARGASLADEVAVAQDARRRAELRLDEEETV